MVLNAHHIPQYAYHIPQYAYHISWYAYWSCSGNGNECIIRYIYNAVVMCNPLLIMFVKIMSKVVRGAYYRNYGVALCWMVLVGDWA